MTSKMAPAQQSSFSFCFFFFSPHQQIFCFSLPPSFVSEPAAARPLKVEVFLGGGFGFESFVLFVRRRSIRVCVHIDLIKQPRY